MAVREKQVCRCHRIAQRGREGHQTKGEPRWLPGQQSQRRASAQGNNSKMMNSEEGASTLSRNALRRGLRHAVAETTHLEHERAHLFEEVEANALDLYAVVQMGDRLVELMEKLGCDYETCEKLHHYCCQEYSKALSVATGERYCVAPTLNYIKWSATKRNEDKPGSVPATPRVANIPKMRSLGNTPVSVGDGAVVALGEEDVPDVASSALSPLAKPPRLSTEAAYNKKMERKQEREERDAEELQRAREEDRIRKERLFKLALRGPKARRPASASPKLQNRGPRKLNIDVAMEARAERKTELLVKGEIESRRARQEAKEKKARLKTIALRGPAVQPRPQRPKSASPQSYADLQSPNRYVPSTSNIQAYHPATDERARQRAKFEEYLKEKESLEAAQERERRVLEEKEEERRVKELRKSMEFKASPLPDLKSRKFSPKNLHYLEPPKPGTVPIREHVRQREEAKAEARRVEEEKRRQREKEEAAELRKTMGSFKARKMPDFSKKPFSPVLASNRNNKT